MTAVEFALVAPVLLLFVIGTAELGIIMAAQSTLDNAIFVASRAGKTGYQDSGKTQAQTILARLQSYSSKFIDSSKITLKSNAYADYDKVGQPEPFDDKNKNGVRDADETYTDVNGNGTYDKDQGKSGYGSTGQIVLYEATYDWKVKTPMLGKLIGASGVVTLSSRAVVKNEPYGG